MAELVYERPYYWYYYPSSPVSWIINTVLGIIEALLALRLVLIILGANPAAQFVAWIYEMTEKLVGPFAGAFPNLSIGGFVLELSTIFAMIGYAIIAWLILQILSFFFVTVNRAI